MKVNTRPRDPRRIVAECVSAILIEEGRVLVEKRRLDDDADPGFVFIPGGHVKPGESLNLALKREMREDLGIRLGKITPIHTRYYTASDGERQRIHYMSKSGRAISARPRRRKCIGNHASIISAI